MYTITIIKNGKAKTYKYTSLQDAKKVAQEIFEKTSIIVGINHE